MAEILLVVGVLAALGAVALVPWTWLIEAAAVVTLLGMLLGVPTGLVYHLRLRSRLLARGVLPARWWWNPVAAHVHLAAADRRCVLPWFYAGGAGFALTTLGCALGVLALPGSLGWLGAS